MGEELAKLLEAGFIKDIKHPDWLANLVMVSKKDKSWRLCVDFKDLNKAYPKDPFPLPRIDQIIDATTGHDSLCCLDAYSGYHQIKMAEPHQAATTFITPYDPFCFNTITFGLKNVGATYQRMIQTCLANQIGKTVEAYVDDVVVKTRHVDSLIDDLRLTFYNLRTYDIKLNPEKCVFCVPAGKLLGFILSGRGIEANPAKIRALSQLDIPKDLKQIQKLTGCVAALSRFISRLGEKALPLYRLLRRTEHFEWTDAATAGLEEIKAVLATNPVLAAPNLGEPMLLYIAATHQVVSAVLVVERETEGHKFPLQKLVYYVSTVLTPCKSRYPHYQKIAYAVFMASRKLRH